MKLQTIVTATDLSDGAAPATIWAHDLSVLSGAAVIAAHVIEISFESWWNARYEVVNDAAKMKVAEDEVIAWYLKAVGTAPHSASVVVDKCPAGLKRVIDETHADLLVMTPTTKGRMMQTIVGSAVQRLANSPPCPLAIVKDEQRLKSSVRIAIAVDFSPSSAEAARVAANLATSVGGELTLVNVASADEQADAHTQLKAFADANLGTGTYHFKIINGDPKEALEEFAKAQDITMMVMGRTGQRSVVGDLLGSVPRHLIATMPCTVIVTPPTSDWQSEMIA